VVAARTKKIVQLCGRKRSLNGKGTPPPVVREEKTDSEERK